LAKTATPGPAAASAAWVSFLDRHSARLAVILVLLATTRIVATYSVFSHTVDEPAHIGCGMEWLVRGTYTYEAQHPPLARVAGALGPYLLGVRPHSAGGPEPMIQDGLSVLYDDGSYTRNLTAARLGVLPFFWVAAAVVYLWARRDFGPAAAVAALFCFTFVPSVLAHAGLATTDMALTAFLGAAFLTGRLCLEQPTLRSGAIFGLLGALAIGSKLSSLPFFAAAAVLALASSAIVIGLPSEGMTQYVRRRLPPFGVATAVACAVLWGLYRFSFGRVEFLPFPVPAPALFAGVRAVLQHNSIGQLSYLLGDVNRYGFPGYYAVVLGVKTPIALLILTVVGLSAAVRNWRTPAWILPVAYSAGVLVVSFFSRINIGVRHILPVYTGFSILAGWVLVQFGSRSARKWIAPANAVLVGWLAISSLVSHPDYLPYFNAFAGSHPENILVDSDLDWGQDIKRLKQVLKTRGISSASICVVSYLKPQPGDPLLARGNPRAPSVGWNIVGATCWKEFRFGLGDLRRDISVWPDHAPPPQETVGKSIYVCWYFAPPPEAPAR
jgi:hypothetical protein